jgi:cytochrome P450
MAADRPEAPKPPNHALSEMRCPVALEDVDLFGPGAQEHWYEAYEILHRESPVLRIAGEGMRPGSDAFVLTRHEDITRVVKDPARFTPIITLAVDAIRPLVEQALEAGREPDLPPGVNAMIVSMASLRPTQELYRAHKLELTDPWVGPGASRHEGMIRRTVGELIDGFIDRGRVEFVGEFARPLPQIVMAHVLGFPLEDLPQLETWGTAMVRPFVFGRGHRNLLPRAELAAQAASLAEFGQYVKDQVARKRRHPADDMTTFLTQVTYSPLGRRLDDLEIEGIVYAMVLGGLETTQYALEEEAQLLCDDPALFDTLRGDRSKLRAFTEEAMRLRAPTQGLSTRMTTRDEVFQGVEVPAGSLLHLRFGAGNVDPEEYACPHRVRLDRKRLGGHLAFSQGPRTCPGAGLSRVEQLCAWSGLLDRIERLGYAPGNTFRHQPGIMLGTLELHLELDAGR